MAAGNGAPHYSKARERKSAAKRLETSVTANHFVLVGDDEKTRAALTSSEEGVWLILADAEGNPRIKLGVDKIGLPSLMLFTASDGEPTGSGADSATDAREPAGSAQEPATGAGGAATKAGGPPTEKPRGVTRLALECVPDVFQPERSVPVVALYGPDGNYQAALLAGGSGGSALTFYGDRGAGFGWSLHSRLGLTRYTSAGSPVGVDYLENLWDAQNIMRVVRNGGKLRAAEVLARLRAAYGSEV